ncbi:MAG: ATP-binding protein [bacterium]|nr:ATP-binding protein [bacterium]
MIRRISDSLARTRTLSRDLAAGLVITMSLVLGAVGFFIYTVGVREAENTLRFQGEDTLTDLQTLLRPYLQNGDASGARGVVSAFLQAGRVLEIRVLDAGGDLIVGGSRNYNPQAMLQLSAEMRLADGDPGRLLVTLSRESVLERKRRILYTIIVVAGFVVLSIIFSTRILLRRFLRAPLDELRRGIQRISAGEYGRSLPPVRQQDIQRIIQSVNQMAHSIERRDQSIKRYATELEKSNDLLERRVLDLNLARVRIENSEKKYKHLVESSQELVFSLDENGVFLTINRAVRNHLGLRPERVRGTRFEDHLYSFDEKSAFLSRDRFREQLERLLSEKQAVNFQTALSTVRDEPRELDVRLEYIPVGDETAPGSGSFVIFGKAASVSEDVLLRHLLHETRRYEIGNYLTVADQLASTITAAVGRHLDEDATIGVRIGLREILINSIEHGNLAISFEEKSRTLENGTYLDLIQERQRDSRYRDRSLGVLYSLRAGRVLFAIQDQGEGFDHRAAFAKEPVGNDLFHGRGITIVRKFFDVVRYNDAGNRVILIKKMHESAK